MVDGELGRSEPARRRISAVTRAGETVADVPLELIGQARDQPRSGAAAEAGALFDPVVEAVALEELKINRLGSCKSCKKGEKEK
ncbi:MAG TPA: hypothetical protein VGO05_04500 [Roseiarcus sp.]|nr:hypothetical protein [Roseiarcus sp.]